ncbi:MAG TPA: HAMP domain-containing sensor histidine kinase, partial [Gemmataceae bacterium]|nr:HAMP domain-containing sensor histidine kinase [Gemmataceae bacterium]
SPATDYFQISSSWGHVWRSRRLGDESLPLSPAMMASTKPVDWYFDDTTLPSGVAARRITLKAWVGRVRINRSEPKKSETSPRRPDERRAENRRPEGPGRGNGPARPPSGRPAQPPARPAPPPPLVFFFQCAAETARKDEAIARLEAGLQDDLDKLQAESDETLAHLRGRLLLIGLVTFGATAVGGLWLVRLSLSPLNRLTEAVRRVSVKDFRLPLDGPPLPRELDPIAARLRETLEELRRAFAREKQAAADISHELRTPLAALLTTIEVSLKKPRSPEEYRETLEDCRASGLQMNQLVERLLKLARLDAGVDPVRPRQVDLAQLAEQCAAMVRPLAEARGLDLRVRRNGPAYLAADPDKLREVVTNLLHNAIEYNKPHGSVELTVERENGHLRVEVRDTGVGIAPEAREHIFERFFRADPSRQAEGLHAGLGLAIVKGYVDLMGGRIDVESEVGQGSTFRVELPAKS